MGVRGEEEFEHQHKATAKYPITLLLPLELRGPMGGVCRGGCKCL